MPTMQIQYNVISYTVSAFLLVFAVRMIMRFVANLTDEEERRVAEGPARACRGHNGQRHTWGPVLADEHSHPVRLRNRLDCLPSTLVGIGYVSQRRNLLARRVNVFKALAVVLAVLLVVQVGGRHLPLRQLEQQLPAVPVDSTDPEGDHGHEIGRPG